MATEAENEKQMTDKKPEPEKKGGFLSAIAKKVTETIGAKKKEEPPQPDEKENHQSGVKGVVQKVEEVGKKIVDKIRMIRFEIRVHAISRCEKKVKIIREENHADDDLQAKLSGYQKQSTMKTLMRHAPATASAEPHSERTSFVQHGGGKV